MNLHACLADLVILQGDNVMPVSADQARICRLKCKCKVVLELQRSDLQDFGDAAPL